MKILIVDDLKSVTDGIIAGVNWHALGSPQVLAANSALEARQIVDDTHIDIVVCDIEMPYENGLELFAYIKKVSPETEGIFLTSHALFQYAQAAIQLQCYQYLLQPIRYEDLESVIALLIQQILQKQQQSEYAQIGTAILQDRDTLVRHFWSNLLLTGTEKKSKASKGTSCCWEFLPAQIQTIGSCWLPSVVNTLLFPVGTERVHAKNLLSCFTPVEN